MGFLSKLAYGSDMKNQAIGEAYTRLIEFFSAQGSLADRFKVRPCFYPPFSRRSCLCLAYRPRKPPKFGPNVSPSANDPMLPSRSSASRSAARLCFHRVESYSAIFGGDGLEVRRTRLTGGSMGATDWKSVVQGDQNVNSLQSLKQPPFRVCKHRIPPRTRSRSNSPKQARGLRR
jgi:hypothetical protein